MNRDSTVAYEGISVFGK